MIARRTMSLPRGRHAVAAFIGALLLAAGVLFSLTARPAAPENFRQTSIVLPDVNLLDRHANPIRLRALLSDDVLVVVNFSYTTCGSICPLGNQILQFVDERRGEIARPVKIISITIDPVEDTPEKMNEAAMAFGASADWHWLTGSPSAIDRVLDSTGADVADIELHDPVFLVGEVGSGRFFRSLSMPDADELIAMLGHFDT